MLNYHDINDIENKVSKTMIEEYKKNYSNLEIASIIAGFHRTYGLPHEGISISMEIVNSIKDDTENIHERNILVWNLYKLSEELINNENIDMGMKMIERAENNWSRDVILADNIGVYHISWIEQIWLKKSEIYLKLNDKINFERTTDLILQSRMNFFKEAEKITGETIFQDRCTYNCFEIMAAEEKEIDVKKAVMLIKQAIIHKGGYEIFNTIEKVKNNKRIKNPLDMYIRYYHKLPEYPYDNVKYGYCSSCKYLEEGMKCKKHEIQVNEYKACSHWKF